MADKTIEDFVKSSDEDIPHDSDDDSLSEDENHKIAESVKGMEEKFENVALEKTKDDSLVKSSDEDIPHDSDDDSLSEDENHKIAESVKGMEEIFENVALEKTKDDSAMSDFVLKKLLPGAAIGTAVVLAAPLALKLVGFGSGGIVGKSIASDMMSYVAKANGGGVPAKSIVSMLQSTGAVGISAATKIKIFSTATLTTIGAIEAESRTKRLVDEKRSEEKFCRRDQYM